VSIPTPSAQWSYGCCHRGSTSSIGHVLAQRLARDIVTSPTIADMDVIVCSTSTNTAFVTADDA
jgi:hypothetical protein